MSRLIYACRFDVEGDDAIDRILSTYTSWIEQHYHRMGLEGFQFKVGVTADQAIQDAHALSSKMYSHEDAQVLQIRWSIPDSSDPGLRWTNEVRIGQFKNRCGVEHLISIESVEYNVAPTRLLFGSPRAIREICQRSPAYVGQMQIRAEPYDVKPNDLGDLITLLTSNLRKLPVVLISPYASGNPNLIDPAALSRNLAGVAIVVDLKDIDLTWDFADEVGRQLSCFNGAARIYWPGFSQESDPRSHRLFFGSWIEQVGAPAAARAIERAIFAVAAYRYVPDQRIAKVIRHVDATERQQQLEDKKETGEDFLEAYERDLVRLEEAERRNAELEAENANLKANQQVLFGVEDEGLSDAASNDEQTARSFSSVSEAVQEAAKQSGNLDILDTAIASANECPFQRPYDVFRALVDLDEIVSDWQRNFEEKGSGGDLLQHLRDRGWGKRSSMHISDTTRGKFRSHYEFEYQGEKRLFEPHITLGAGDPNSCASIHFMFDSKLRKMIIGHVGKHLPNTKT